MKETTPGPGPASSPAPGAASPAPGAAGPAPGAAGPAPGAAGPAPGTAGPAPSTTGTGLRAVPLAAASRVKDAAVDLASDLAKEYRKSSRFDRQRAAVVGGLALLSLLTVCVAFSSPGTNELKAFAQLQQGGLLGTQISVENRSGELWTDVTLTLDGGWQYQVPTIREQFVVGASRFTKDGATAPEQLVPKTITVRCEQGSATVAFSARSP